MKKYAIPGIIIGVALLVGAIFAFSPKANDYTNNQQTNTPTADSSAPQASSSTTAAEGSYVDYSEQAFANAQGTRILFFHAAWCPQCKALDASIKAGAVPQDTTILKVDFDSSQDLRRKYGVTTQTTVVKVDNSGNLVSKYVAYSTPSLDAVLGNL